MKASLIIAIYNNIRFLKAVLDSLQFQTEKDFEIIIAEDGETPAVKEFVDSYNFEQPWQHLTQKDEGWRKNQAMNMAIRAAKSDWLIFIDGDCVLHPRFVEMHIRFSGENSILAGKRVKLDKSTTVKLLSERLKIIDLQKRMFRKLFIKRANTKFIEEGFFISPDGLLGFIPKIRKNDKLVGSNMSFSKKAIYAINGFDEDYQLPAVGEDFDLTWRFDAAGYKHVSLRNLAVQYHLQHHENWTDQNENMEICRQKQKENNFFCKNGLIKK
ncbi:MAG: glycosyltransferase [Paludibacter sp.]